MPDAGCRMHPVADVYDYRAEFYTAMAPQTTYQQCLALIRGRSVVGWKFASHCLSSSRVDVVFILTIGFSRHGCPEVLEYLFERFRISGTGPRNTN